MNATTPLASDGTFVTGTDLLIDRVSSPPSEQVSGQHESS
jgi:hypothetical protein